MDSRVERAIELDINLSTVMALDKFEAAIARDPNDKYAYAEMAWYWHSEKQYAKALDHFNTAIRLDPDFCYALISRACLRSTCPDAVFRDGAQAVDDATRALNIAKHGGKLIRDWRHRMYLQILAASYAEMGDFDMAIEIENEALVFAVTEGNTYAIKRRVSQYESHEALREEENNHIIRFGPIRESDI